MAAAGVTRLFLGQHSQRDIQFLHILIPSLVTAELILTFLLEAHADQKKENRKFPDFVKLPGWLILYRFAPPGTLRTPHHHVYEDNTH